MLPGSDRRRAALDALYDIVPEMACLGLCQHACTSPIDIVPTEVAILGDIGQVMAANNPKMIGLRPKEVAAGACVALDGAGRCTVYADRPFMCRIWGAASFFACPFGCVPEGGFMGDVEALQAIVGWSLIDETEPKRAEFGQFMRDLVADDIEFREAFLHRTRVYANRTDKYSERDCAQADVVMLQVLGRARERMLARQQAIEQAGPQPGVPSSGRPQPRSKRRAERRAGHRRQR